MLLLVQNTGHELSAANCVARYDRLYNEKTRPALALVEGWK